MPKTLIALLVLLAPVSALAAGPVTPNVTRAEAAMLLLQARLPVVPDMRDSRGFPDVVPGAWYERYVVLGERYGLLSADPVTRRIRPDDPVRRWEFLRMMTYSFGLPENLPHGYKDVPANTAAAKYAGLASTYGLFPGDTVKTQLRPQNEVAHAEAARAVWILSEAMNAKRRQAAGTKATAQDQASYRLQLYQKMSSQQEQVTVLPSAPTGPAAGPAPLLTEPVIPGRRPGDDVTQLFRLRGEVLMRVNGERAKVGLPALRLNPTLEASAQIYAEEMVSRGFFGHVNPEGRTLRDRMTASGYYRATPGCPDCINRYVLGENLGQGQLTPAEIVRDWMQSQTHRDAMLSTNFSEAGVGVSAGIWVMHFGGRK